MVPDLKTRDSGQFRCPLFMNTEVLECLPFDLLISDPSMITEVKLACDLLLCNVQSVVSYLNIIHLCMYRVLAREDSFESAVHCFVY
jgi:hypothetical protein